LSSKEDKNILITIPKKDLKPTLFHLQKKMQKKL